jgi:hypothetical protein
LQKTLRMQYLFWPPSTRLEKLGGNSLLYC